MEAERRTWVVDRQRAQRLLKSLHRDDTDRPRVLPRDSEVVPARHKEHVHMRVARADRFLLGGADLADAAVRSDRSRGRDLVAVVDVAATLLEDLQREGQAGRRAADVSEIELDREG